MQFFDHDSSEFGRWVDRSGFVLPDGSQGRETLGSTLTEFGRFAAHDVSLVRSGLEQALGVRTSASKSSSAQSTRFAAPTSLWRRTAAAALSRQSIPRILKLCPSENPCSEWAPTRAKTTESVRGHH